MKKCFNEILMKGPEHIILERISYKIKARNIFPHFPFLNYLFKLLLMLCHSGA